MAKYIHKQAAIHALVNEANIHNNPIKRAYTRAAAIIEQITAEDVQPVKRGRWTRIDDEYGHDYVCSVCNNKNDRKSHYCPDCGARMDGDTNG